MKKLMVISIATLLSACSMTANNVAGTYQGTLPCSDCDKIEAKLVLKSDKSYIYETTYFQNKQPNEYLEKGQFEWDAKKEDVIVLDEHAGNRKFKIRDNYVEMCDQDGNVAKTGLNYKLKKVQVKK
ncbi:Copper homeostasis protein CutF [Phocoenobacter uteri]|uniref:Copper homeostasis protein CutF n=1 Tax=Phocoenobacter uteri TaxID=146806 RepID=A0A379CC43_9PAST|nr:copper resistance protein NlpE [Phocoenobacter uteri]MDG6881270.1 hypothetical protein [Phocoenobacter uteri]SUB59295.1 Copper homeostasis protein CutF [Phocoenobacter uteri]